MKRFSILASIIILLAVVFFLPENTARVQANDSHQTERCKYFTSYVVEREDTLWDIAERYLTPEYESIYIYIDEVMKSNHLEGTTIFDGQMLILPYYADAPISDV